MLKGMTKHEEKEHGKTPKHEATLSINHKATQNKNNTGTAALEWSVEYISTVLFLINIFLAFLKSLFALLQLSLNHFGLLVNVILLIFYFCWVHLHQKLLLHFHVRILLKLQLYLICSCMNYDLNQMYVCFVVRVLYNLEPYLH